MCPTVSVVVPAYNRAATIRPAIESVLRQSWEDFELLVVDDCSSDATLARAAEIDDPRLRCLSTSHNKGPSGARNLGIQEARGAWVAFQDSDDEWLPDKLARQMASLEARGAPCVAGYCGMIIENPPETAAGTRTEVRYHPGPRETCVEGDILPALLTASLVSTQTLIARRDTLRAIGGFDEELPALVDWDCALRLATNGSFAFVDAPLVLQRFSANSVTADRWRRAAARRRIVEKHRTLMATRPGVLARHWRSVAGEERRMGKTDAAREALARARREKPLDLQLWGLSAVLAVSAALPGRPPA